MPKSIMVMCPTCNGAGIEKTVGGSCPRCNGDGAVKMSPKAIKRLAKKMQEQQ
jgi:DnaJ-class molecular chaperone